jgi:hypothetical protein
MQKQAILLINKNPSYSILKSEHESFKQILLLLKGISLLQTF